MEFHKLELNRFDLFFEKNIGFGLMWGTGWINEVENFYITFYIPFITFSIGWAEKENMNDYEEDSC